MIKLTIEQVKSRLPSHISIDESTYKGSDKKARFIDSEYGEWWTYPYVINRGGNHPKRGNSVASKKNSISISEVIKRLPDHIKIVESTYKNINTKCRFIDSEYGEFETKPGSILYRGVVGHPNRGKEINANKRKTIFIKDIPAKDWCNVKNVPYGSLKGLFSNFGEDYIVKWTENYNNAKSELEILFEKEFGFKIFNKYPNEFLKYKPDFQLSNNLFLNVDGLYWHSEKFRQKDYHLIMAQKFREAGITLLQFR